jgi:arginase
MPKVLVGAGLLEGLPLARHIVLTEPSYSFEPDDASGIRNHLEMIRFTRVLDRTISGALDSGFLPVIIGGDCSVLLGPAVALKRLGRYALVHVDGHNDFGHEGNWGKPYASVAGADLAVVTGRGPDTLANLDGLRPYFRDEDVVQLGEKADAHSPDYLFKDFPLTAIHQLPLAAVRRGSIEEVLNKLVSILASAPTKGFWLHVDLDVLDANLMPAVDSPENIGLSWDELDTVLSRLLKSPSLVGMNIGIYDPELDPSGAHARHIASMLHRHLIEIARPIGETWW